MVTKVVSVVLAGGSGTRLWPVSRESYPKQFCKFFDKLSLLQQTIIRLTNIYLDTEIIIITNENYYFLCKDQIESLGINNSIHYILEPCPKNTAPAIALAAAYANSYIDSNAILFVLPSDHYLEDNPSWHNTVKTALDFSKDNNLIVFGIKPSAPKTGYGYIEKGISLKRGAFRVNRFVEKPSYKVANSYLATKNFYWNSGMFMFSISSYLNALARLASDIYQQSMLAFRSASACQEFFRIHKSFADCRSVSIDYAVMENTKNAIVFPLDVNWNDLGCWSSVAESSKADKNGNVCHGNVMVHGGKDCLISSETSRVIAIGIKDQVVVNTPDAVLVANKAYSQDVKKVVEQLELQGDAIATKHKRIYQPWGYYENLSSGFGYEIDILMVNPGVSLSLQLCYYHFVHWIVVNGKAEIIADNEVFRLQANQSACIVNERKYQLTNASDECLSIIEVKSGNYLAKSDKAHFENKSMKINKAKVQDQQC